METLDCDLLVIGGGPCGSTAAALARKAGMNVVLVEKHRFPRFRIGESLLPMGNRVLVESGAWPKVASAGFIRKLGGRFYTADGRACKRIDFSRGLVPGLDSTFQVERARFDQILLEHAREQGAVVREGWTVAALEQDERSVTATLRADGDGHAELRARWCIDAGGRDNFYPSDMKRQLEPLPFERRVAVYSHYRGVQREDGPEGGDTVIVRLDDGWFWLIPIDAERTSVGLVTTKDALRSAGREPGSVFMRAVADSPLLRERMARATPAMGFFVTADYSYFRKTLARGRIVLAGDAGGFFDPIFSSGVYMGLWGARQAAAMVARAHAAGRALHRFECARYAVKVKRHAGVFAKLIRTFYNNKSFSVFMSEAPPWDLERGINSIVAGHATLTWGLRWRLAVFLVVCRLNQRYELVPTLRISARVRETADRAA